MPLHSLDAFDGSFTPSTAKTLPPSNPCSSHTCKTAQNNGKISAWVYYTLQSVSTNGDTSNTYGLIADGTWTDKAVVSHHFYRYIRPGARQVASTSDDGDVKVVAFHHEANDCHTIVFMNEASSARTVTALNGAGLPSQWEMVTSTQSQRRVTSTVSAGQQISLPANSIVTLVAGSYRNTVPVSVSPSRERGAALVPARTVVSFDLFNLRGQRVSLSHLRRFGSAPLAAGVYCNRAAHRALPFSVTLPNTPRD